METPDINPLLEDFEGNIDDLEDVLKPLSHMSLVESTSRLPLLDKAKTYVLITYAIESILFSYLRLNGADAKEHPVFRELARVKQYFEKIKLVEAGDPAPSNLRLDKEAANRFINHSLAGNHRHDRERALQEERTKASAQAKLEELSRLAKRKASALESKRIASDSVKQSSSSDDIDTMHSEPSTKGKLHHKTAKKSKKKKRRKEAIAE